MRSKSSESGPMKIASQVTNFARRRYKPALIDFATIRYICPIEVDSYQTRSSRQQALVPSSFFWFGLNGWNRRGGGN